MVGRACRMVLAALVGVLVGVVVFAVAVLPFFGIWEPLAGFVVVLAMSAVLTRAARD